MTDLIDILQANLFVFVSITFLFSLFVGSFLNVVIYRLPLMMERDWKQQCEELAGKKHAEHMPEETFNLVLPRSRCVHCGHQIRAYENIPILSYLLLRGRCSNCHSKISLRYPFVELLTAVLSATVAWQFGFGWQALAAIILTWALIALTFIDLDHKLLPDSITLPFLWIGLLLSLGNVFVDPATSIVGAVAGYLSLWLVYQGFKIVTGKEGMGFGDFKLLAMLGAWVGWKYLPVIILFSSAVGAVTGIALVAVGKRQRGAAIPFGPFLAAAGWLTVLWGENIVSTYLNLVRS